MHASIVDDRDRRSIRRDAVNRGDGHAATQVLGIRDRDLVPRAAILPRDCVLRPRRGDARIDAERLAAPPEAEHALETGAIEPRGRAGIPAPATAAGVR